MLALSGCGIRTAKGMLDSAEAIMNERPDSALMLLEDLDSAEVRGREMKARYSLLMSMALDKNVIDTADISVILPALRYYGHRGDVLSRARTYFYYGRVLQNGGDNEAALEAVSKAELYAGQTDDLYLQGLIADCKGRIYEDDYEFENAIALYKEALYCFQHIDNLSNEKRMHEVLSRVYDKCGSSDIALQHAKDALYIAYEIGDLEGIIDANLSIANAYYDRGDGQIAKEIVKNVTDRYCQGEMPILYYPLASLLCLSDGDIAGARNYAKAISSEDNAGVYALLSEIEKQAGDYKKSLEYLNKFIDLNFEERIKRLLSMQLTKNIKTENF